MRLVIVVAQCFFLLCMSLLASCRRDYNPPSESRYEVWCLPKDVYLDDLMVDEYDGKNGEKATDEMFPGKPPYSDAEATQMVRRRRALSFPTITTIANEVLGIDGRLLQSSFGGTRGNLIGNSYSLSPSINITYRYRIVNYREVSEGLEEFHKIQLVEVWFYDHVRKKYYY